MDCNFIKLHLFDYQEGVLPDDERMAFDEHLRSCRACSLIYKRFVALNQRIEELKAVEVDPFLATRLIQRIENRLDAENARLSPSLVARLKPVVAILGIFLAVTIGIFLGKMGSAGHRSTEAHINEIRNIQTDLQINDFIDEDNIIISRN
jgi:predicted anti-sigma-YlaC factor YlaD